jgi:MtrB/PioB family decaheme-associated outer membrane protein
MKMKRKFIIVLSLLSLTLLLWPVSGIAAEEAVLSGGVDIAVRTVDGERESAKFEEYSEIPDGASAGATVKYKTDNYFFHLKVKDAGEDDQNLKFSSGKYGKFRIELEYDKLPHRFAYDARTLHSGVGTGNLVLGDALQEDLQNTRAVTDLTGDGIIDGRDHMVNDANRLKSFFDRALTTDLELFRKNGKANIDITGFDPINFRIEFRREERDGTRPFSGSFGFGNVVEIPEPIDYDTTELRLTAEYSKKPYYLSASYFLSVFENNIDTLAWDNPFRVTDSTTAGAYSTPTGGSASNAFTYAVDGAARGLIDLYPDNTYHNISLTGSLVDLPLKSRLTATASWGWMKQDDDIVPFTTNTSIVPGAADNPPFDASDPANLPAKNIDAEVNTALYNILLTSKPMKFMRVKARYRYYEYDNDTEQIHIPGYVRTDAVWEEVPEENLPTGYKKTTAGVDLGFDIAKSTTLTVGYTYDGMKRTHREVAKSDEDIFRVSVDSSPLSWLTLRASYEASGRDGHYDYTVPFEGETVTAQLPFLRKYDEANRDRDRFQLTAILYPIETLTVSGSLIYGKDEFDESDFGLLEDKHNIYSVDADYALSEKINLSAFYSHERFKNLQKARQWTPGSVGDPYTTETALDSNSNWNADNKDKVNTFGCAVDLGIAKNLDFKVSYSISKTDGEIRLSSPLGTSANDSNAFVPIDFADVDDIELQSLNAKVKYSFSKRASLALGFLHEKYNIGDFDITGFDNVPTTATGAFNGALFMGTQPKDYEANVIYAKLSYSF